MKRARESERSERWALGLSIPQQVTRPAPAVTFGVMSKLLSLAAWPVHWRLIRQHAESGACAAAF